MGISESAPSLCLRRLFHEDYTGFTGTFRLLYLLDLCRFGLPAAVVCHPVLRAPGLQKAAAAQPAIPAAVGGDRRAQRIRQLVRKPAEDPEPELSGFRSRGGQSPVDRRFPSPAERDAAGIQTPGRHGSRAQQAPNGQQKTAADARDQKSAARAPHPHRCGLQPGERKLAKTGCAAWPSSSPNRNKS
jgi:hypothetical protein